MFNANNLFLEQVMFRNLHLLGQLSHDTRSVSFCSERQIDFRRGTFSRSLSAPQSVASSHVLPDYARIRMPIPCPAQAQGPLLLHMQDADERSGADLHLLPQVLRLVLAGLSQVSREVLII
ncbi:hypothetical protein CEXT_58161 [Caerostris extrusa]|uniref:Uncharacterized protein n=1 Tax=Caerostris extrusa TaxID=172846 RepID=A0AAV4MVU4_CAEEX|nr:hypothetical protein CEXT_58161 [Caerostris extrusa]